MDYIFYFLIGIIGLFRILLILIGAVGFIAQLMEFYMDNSQFERQSFENRSGLPFQRMDFLNPNVIICCFLPVGLNSGWALVFCFLFYLLTQDILWGLAFFKYRNRLKQLKLKGQYRVYLFWFLLNSGMFLGLYSLVK